MCRKGCCLMEFVKEKTCCFTGHRSIDKNDKENISKNLESVICFLFERGIDTFLCGGALGFDLFAARTVLRLRERLEIKLVMVIPCRNQADGWSLRDKLEYEEILSAADEVLCLNEKYVTGCMHQRNRFMVKASSVCIAYFDGRLGGTRHTIKLAEDEELEIIRVNSHKFC